SPAAADTGAADSSWSGIYHMEVRVVSDTCSPAFGHAGTGSGYVVGASRHGVKGINLLTGISGEGMSADRMDVRDPHEGGTSRFDHTGPGCSSASVHSSLRFDRLPGTTPPPTIEATYVSEWTLSGPCPNAGAVYVPSASCRAEQTLTYTLE